MLTLIVVSWVLSGAASFIYWWTTEHDLSIWNLLGSLVAGVVMGPFAFIVGWGIHSKESSSKDEPFIVMKKRK